MSPMLDFMVGLRGFQRSGFEKNDTLTSVYPTKVLYRHVFASSKDIMESGLTFLSRTDYATSKQLNFHSKTKCHPSPILFPLKVNFASFGCQVSSAALPPTGSQRHRTLSSKETSPPHDTIAGRGRVRHVVLIS